MKTLLPLTLILAAILFEWSNGMPVVQFKDQRFNFPAGATEEQMKQAIGQYIESQGGASQFLPTPDSDHAMRSENPQLAPSESYLPEATPEGEQPVIQQVHPVSGKVAQFAEVIADVETGGQPERSIRTKAKPTVDGRGSSAYGTYQITRGLLRGALENNTVNFTEQERAAAQELINRQEIALAVGGRDRKHYQKGGSKHGMAQRWAKSYGYEDVNQFLDDFDYGGTYGLAEDGDFQVLYESFARKLLNHTLKQAEGDVFKAARVWHGGPKGAGKSTDLYEQKVRKVWESRYGGREEG